MKKPDSPEIESPTPLKHSPIRDCGTPSWFPNGSKRSPRIVTSNKRITKDNNIDGMPSRIAEIKIENERDNY